MKNVLLAVSGLSPQVITETLYALHQQQKRIDAVHIVTTRPGKEKINAFLLSPADGRYCQYLKEYGIDSSAIDFGFHNIHTIKNGHAVEIDDIEGEEENEMLLKKCLELAFALTRDPDTAVFFSIAGGRKTMSASLTLAAQMYGRPQDRLYHVLVSPEFESNRDFYYPPRKSVAIEITDKKGQRSLKETRYAKVTLVPIPFVSVRDRIADDLLKQPSDPATLMLSLVREESPRLTVDLVNAKITYKNLEMDMMPARLALYAFFAMLKKNCSKDVKNCTNCSECYISFEGIEDAKDGIAALYRKIPGSRDLSEMSRTGIKALDIDNFRSARSKIGKDLARGFGLYATYDLAIEPFGKKPNTRYGLPIDKGRIKVIF